MRTFGKAVIILYTPEAKSRQQMVYIAFVSQALPEFLLVEDKHKLQLFSYAAFSLWSLLSSKRSNNIRKYRD